MSTATFFPSEAAAARRRMTKYVWLLVWIGLFLALPTRGFSHDATLGWIVLAAPPTLAWWYLARIPFEPGLSFGSEMGQAVFAFFLHWCVWLSPIFVMLLVIMAAPAR